MPYKQDRRWADAREARIRELLATIQAEIVWSTFRRSSRNDDIKYGVDYEVTTATGQLACRVRRASVSSRDITIRRWRQSQVRTEYEKLMDGWGRYYLFCWVSETPEDPIATYAYLDLDAIRNKHLFCPCEREERENKDGQTRFYAWPIGKFIDHGAVIAASDDLWARRTWTEHELAAASLEEFHAAVDALEEDTVPKTYYDKVWEHRSKEPCAYHGPGKGDR